MRIRWGLLTNAMLHRHPQRNCSMERPASVSCPQQSAALMTAAASASTSAAVASPAAWLRFDNAADAHSAVRSAAPRSSGLYAQAISQTNT